jgi:hypothetical protein
VEYARVGSVHVQCGEGGAEDAGRLPRVFLLYLHLVVDSPAVKCEDSVCTLKIVWRYQIAVKYETSFAT